MGANGSLDAAWEICGCGKQPPPGVQAGGVRLSSEVVNNAKLLRGAREGDAVLLRQALDVGANTEVRQSLRAGPGSLSHITNSSREPDTPRLPERCAPGLTPLMHAARGGHLTCVMALLDARAAVDAADEDGRTALHFAAMAGDIDCFKGLVLSAGTGLVRDRFSKLPLEHLPEDLRRKPNEYRRWEAVMRNELFATMPPVRAGY